MAGKISQYYEAESAYIYPSSNASDGGDNNSERNIRTITEKISVRNFVVKRDGSNPLGLTESTDGAVKVSAGECVIQGYYLNLKDIEIPVITASGTSLLDRSTTYHVVVQLLKDGSGLVRGDGTIVQDGKISTQLYCKGAMVLLVNDTEYAKLDQNSVFESGTFTSTTDGKVNTTTIAENIYKYSFIDSESILTPSGIKIEDWVQNLVDHLNVLNYYENEDDEEPTTSLVVEEGKVYRVSGTTRDEVLTRAEIAASGGNTDLSTVSSIPTTDTQNGTSGSVSRADHKHDGRYVISKLGCTVSTVIQKIATGLHVLGEFRVGGTESAAKTILESDGSVSVAGGNLTVSADGNLSGKQVQGTSLKSTSGVEMAAAGTLKQGTTTIVGTGGKVYGAVWNDYAEWYLSETPGEVIEPGTVIAKIKGKGTYGAAKDCSNLVVGVCSDSYGHIVGGDSLENMEDNNGKYIPVALAGRVRVKVVKGALIEEGDLLSVSAIPGLATASPRPERGLILGKALESSDGTKSSVLMQVLLS